MSTSKTNTPAGQAGNMIQQAVGVFNTCSQRNTQMRHLTGSMPQAGAAAAAAGGKQSKTSMPIVQAQFQSAPAIAGGRCPARGLSG